MASKFMDPHDVETIPGTEGWERMYPYHYQFSREDPLRAEHESNQLWTPIFDPFGKPGERAMNTPRSPFPLPIP